MFVRMTVNDCMTDQMTDDRTCISIQVYRRFVIICQDNNRSRLYTTHFEKPNTRDTI